MVPKGGLHGGITMVLSAILVVLGVAMLITTLTEGGGVFSYGVIVGLCFIAAGAARLWLAVQGRKS